MPKNILITGGYSDIGLEVVENILDKTSQNIIVTTTTQEKLSLFKSDRVSQITLDVTSEDQLAVAAELISQSQISHFIQLHGNCIVPDRLLEQDIERLTYHFNVNVFSTILLLRSILEHMVAENFGRIVLMNTASSDHGGGSESFGYGMAKHSVSFLTKHIAKNFGQYNILANCISPGFIATKFQHETMKRGQEAIVERSQSIPIKRAGRAKDVAATIYHLCFENDFITGQNITLDGGDFI